MLVEAVDKDGNLCPLAMNQVRFKLTGPARIAGVGNGDHHFPAEFDADHVTLFYGKAMLIAQDRGGARRARSTSRRPAPAWPRPAYRCDRDGERGTDNKDGKDKLRQQLTTDDSKDGKDVPPRPSCAFVLVSLCPGRLRSFGPCCPVVAVVASGPLSR